MARKLALLLEERNIQLKKYPEFINRTTIEAFKSRVDHPTFAFYEKSSKIEIKIRGKSGICAVI